MAQVGIYLLGDVNDDPQMTICKLCDKYTAANRRIYGYTERASEEADLDQKLWVFRDGSFVTHERYVGAPVEEPLPAMLIGMLEGPPSHREVLVNMALQIPAWYGNFERVVEVVPKGKDVREACRTRLKQYKADGHEVKVFEQDPSGKWVQRA